MNPYILLGLAIAWIASLIGVGLWQNEAGHVSERVTWQTREIRQNNEYAVAVKKAEEDRRTEERRHAAELAAIDAKHAKEIEDAKKQKDRDVAAARAGTLSLRFNAPRLEASGCEPGQAATSPGRGDGGTTTELPRPLAADLLALADDADEVTRQLSACQAIVRADREP